MKDKLAPEAAWKKDMTLTIKIPQVNAFTLGQLFFFFEFQTAVAGELYNINAFDQPGVEDGKKITARLMGKRDRP